MMTKYWVISPHRLDKPEWEKAWQYDLSHGTIAIGWRELGDVSSYDKDQLEKAVKERWPKSTPGQISHTVNAIWNFWHEIEVGDIVIARKGTMQLAAFGTVTQTAFYDIEKGKDRVGGSDDYYPNFIGVEWLDSPDFRRDIHFDEIVFAYSAIYKTDKDGYDKIRNKIPRSNGEKETLVLERYLEELIVSNFDKIFEGELELYTTPEGDVAPQYQIEGIGIIDILAIEPETNAFVVIELKKGRAVDQVVGQILRYMGGVDKHLCEGGQQVKGIIICEGADPKLLSALRMIPNVELKYYNIDLKLEDVTVEKSSNLCA
jgi:hypothetical protein